MQQYTRLLEEKLDAFYQDFARFGEVAPGRLFRLEGFIEAGLALELVSKQQARRMIDHSYGRYMAEAAPDMDWVDAPAGLVLPVVWGRAPVYPANGNK